MLIGCRCISHAALYRTAILTYKQKGRQLAPIRILVHNHILWRLPVAGRDAVTDQQPRPIQPAVGAERCRQRLREPVASRAGAGADQQRGSGPVAEHVAVRVQPTARVQPR